MNILIHKLSPKIGILERNSSGTKCTPNSHVYTPFLQLEYLFLKKTFLELTTPPIFRFTPPSTIGLFISFLHPFFLLIYTSDIT